MARALLEGGIVKDLFRRTTSIAGFGVVCLIASPVAGLEAPPDPLNMQEPQPEISQGIARLIEELHYAQPHLDNSLSSAILDRYLDTLDSNRMYFLASDVAFLGRYRYQLDNRVKSGQLEPAFEIFNVFRDRVRERVTYALELLETEPDFTIQESFRFDRTELAWPVSEDEMKELWRLRVKSDALSLVLADQPWPDIVKTLTDRYERSYSRIADLTSNDVFESFMNAVAHTMDPHSSYFSPRQSEEFRIEMSLSYEGIGARLRQQDEHVEIVEILPGGPAHIDGQLKPGDRITAVEQASSGGDQVAEAVAQVSAQSEASIGPSQPSAERSSEQPSEQQSAEQPSDPATEAGPVHVVGWRLDEVVQLIRGPSGSTVRLHVLPAGAAPGSPQNVISLVRDRVKDEARAAQKEVLDVELDGRSYKVGVIEVPSFYQDFAARSRGEEGYTSTSRDVERLIGELESEGIAGIVVDLRENGGGLLSEALEMSGLFIDRGPLLQVRETNGQPTVLDDPFPSQAYDGPLAVLVDRYSASASEIFAAAIQDYGRGVIVGQQTFGKGSVQNPFDLDRIMRGTDYGQLTLTVGKYYRVTGDSTQNRGVIPDIELPALVPMDTIGENTYATALPWDRIQPTRYEAQPSLDTLVTSLRTGYSDWVAEDPNFEYLLQNIEAMTDVRSRTSVSLNLVERKAERERDEAERLTLENQRREALGLQPLASLEDVDSGHSPDRVQLELAAQVVADLVRRTAGGQPGEI